MKPSAAKTPLPTPPVQMKAAPAEVERPASQPLAEPLTELETAANEELELVESFFDPRAAGEAAALALVPCFVGNSVSKPFLFGAGVLIDAETGTAKKVFLGESDQFQTGQRSCVTKALADTQIAEPPPTRTSLVNYRFEFRDGELQASLQ